MNYVGTVLKGIVRPFEFGGVTRLIWSNITNWQVFLYYFNDTISREKQKIIDRGLGISGLALSNQSKLPAFFSPRQVNLKISHRLLRMAKSRKMIYLPKMAKSRKMKNGQIPEDDLPRLAKSRLMRSRNLKRGSDETKALFRDVRFRLVVSRNW